MSTSKLKLMNAFNAATFAFMGVINGAGMVGGALVHDSPFALEAGVLAGVSVVAAGILALKPPSP
jgi:hypothetical protein